MVFPVVRPTEWKWYLTGKNTRTIQPNNTNDNAQCDFIMAKSLQEFTLAYLVNTD